MNLVRFRANPKKVRISLRQRGNEWFVTIARRPDHWRSPAICLSGASARKTLVLALHAASEANMPGIDMGMGWAYPHPQRRDEST